MVGFSCLRKIALLVGVFPSVASIATGAEFVVRDFVSGRLAGFDESTPLRLGFHDVWRDGGRDANVGGRSAFAYATDGKRVLLKKTDLQNSPKLWSLKLGARDGVSTTNVVQLKGKVQVTSNSASEALTLGFDDEVECRFCGSDKISQGLVVRDLVRNPCLLPVIFKEEHLLDMTMRSESVTEGGGGIYRGRVMLAGGGYVELMFHLQDDKSLTRCEYRVYGVDQVGSPNVWQEIIRTVEFSSASFNGYPIPLRMAQAESANNRVSRTCERVYDLAECGAEIPASSFDPVQIAAVGSQPVKYINEEEGRQVAEVLLARATRLPPRNITRYFMFVNGCVLAALLVWSLRRRTTSVGGAR
jgi:hypothetical protein